MEIALEIQAEVDAAGSVGDMEEHHRGNEHPKDGIAEASPEHRAILRFARACRGKCGAAVAANEQSRCHGEDLQHGHGPKNRVNAKGLRDNAATECDEDDANWLPESERSECFADLARRCQMRCLGAGKALDGSAAQAVFIKEQHKEA